MRCCYVFNLGLDQTYPFFFLASPETCGPDLAPDWMSHFRPYDPMDGHLRAPPLCLSLSCAITSCSSGTSAI